MSDTRRYNFYWPYISANVDHIVRTRLIYARNHPKYRHRRKLPRLPASEPLVYVTMDIAGPFPKTSECKQYIIGMTEQYSKFTRAIPTVEKTAPHIANIYFDYWIISNGIPAYALSNDVNKFFRKLFALMRGLLGDKNLATTAYHPQKKGKAGRFNRIIFVRL